MSDTGRLALAVFLCSAVGTGFLVIAAVSGCTAKVPQARVTLKVSKTTTNRSAPAAASDMDCVFLNVTGTGVGSTFPGTTFGCGATSTCLGLGVVSQPVALTSSTEVSLSVLVKPGASRVVEVFGYKGPLGASCGSAAVSSLLADSSATLYSLGSKTADIAGDTTLTIQSSYTSAATDKVAACLSNSTSSSASIFAWDGASYHNLGLTANAIYTVYVDSFYSDLYVGGDFQDAGGNADADYIAKYNHGSGSWDAVVAPGQPFTGAVRSIYFDGGSHNLYVGGDFLSAGGNTAANRVAFVDLSGNVSGFSSGPADNSVHAVFYYAGNLYVGGNFTSTGSNSVLRGLAMYTASWIPVGNGLNAGTAQVNTMVWDGGSNLFVGGNFTSSGSNGVSLSNVGVVALASPNLNGLNGGPTNSPSGEVKALAYFGSNLYASGNFTSAGGIAGADYVARFSSGNLWGGLTSWSGDTVAALSATPTQLYLGGSFSSANSVAGTANIAAFDGSAFSSLGNGVNGSVTCLATDASNVYLGGTFSQAN